MHTNKDWGRCKRRVCAVVGCTNFRRLQQQTTSHIVRFDVPKESKQRLRWLNLIDREDLVDAPVNVYNYKVCEIHFDQKDILEYVGDDQYVTLQKKILRPGAVPCLQLPIFGTIFELAAQTSVSKTPQSYLEPFHRVCDRFLEPDVANIVKVQALDEEIKKTSAYKQFCLSLFYTCPEVYVILQKILGLPPTKEINKKMGIPFSSHLNTEMLSTLKNKFDKMSNKEKNCAVLVCKKDIKTNLFYNVKIDRIIGFSEINGIQKPTPANQVVVLMAQGILTDWKQLIAFALLSPCDTVNEISKWIDSIIIKLFDIGLNVRAVVSDPDNDFIRTDENQRNDNYFHINDRKIYYFYDIGLLLKTMHRLLLTLNFYYEDSHVVKLKHLKWLYEVDKVQKVNLAAELKSEHLKSSKISKLTTQHAKQIFSKAVGTAIATYVHFKAISDSGMDTAEFMILMSKLHKILTKKTLFGTNNDLTFLIRMMNLFHSLKLYTENGDMIENFESKEAFQVTISSTLSLLADLQAENHKFIKLKNLQFDAFLTIYGKIQKNFAKGKMAPTSRQFINGFRSLYFSDFDKTSYRKQDLSNELLSYAKLLENLNDDLGSQNNPEQRHAFTEVNCADYNNLDIQQNESILKISSYLLDKCYTSKHTCEQLKLYMDRDNKSKSYAVFENYMMENPYDLDFHIRSVAPDEFVFYMERLEQKFYNAFEETHITNPIASSIYEQIKNDKLVPCCSNFPISYMQKLFIRLRIYFMIKHNNIGFRNNQEFSV